MNRILWPLGIMLLIGSVLGAGWMWQHNAVDQANNGNLDSIREIDCLAIVDVEDGVSDLYPSQMGKVVEVASARIKDKDGVEKERVFKKGDLLLRLESDVAELQLGKAKAALAAAQAELTKANKLEAERKVKLEIQTNAIAAAKYEKTRLDEDLEAKKKALKEKIGETPQSTLRMMQAAVDAAKAKVAIEEGKLEAIKLIDPALEVTRARADVDAKEHDIKIAEENLKNYRLEAPFDGVVLRWHTRVGEVLGPNPKAPAVEFCPIAPRIARAEVIQEWGHKVHVGQEATIQDDVYQGPEWQGKVKSISPWYAPKRMRVIEPFMTNDVRTLECIVEFTGGQSPVRIGQRLRVKIKT
jgi:multidrug resistance efflux pump